MLQPTVLVQPTPQERARLMEVWEWNDVTGDPIPVPPPPTGAPVGIRGWRRHVPRPVRVTQGNTFFGTPAHQDFLNGMANNDVASFDVHCDLNVDPHRIGAARSNDITNAKDSCVAMIHQMDLKKITVESRNGGVIRITKHNDPLLPWVPWVGPGPVPLPREQPAGMVAEFRLISHDQNGRKRPLGSTSFIYSQH